MASKPTREFRANAAMEAVFKTIKAEPLWQRPWRSRRDTFERKVA